MRKHITKFIAAFVLIVVAVTMAMMGTYAWVLLSTDPAAGNMKVSVGSSENVTILIAPDVTDADGRHYPGAFAKSLNFGASDAYDLSGFSGLTPVSTADGVNWFGPVYASVEDGGERIGYQMLAGSDVTTIEGTVYAPVYDLSGDPVSVAELEGSAVNVTNGRTDGGSYVALDFWVVSPEEDYELRVSTKVTKNDQPDTFDAGSFVLALPSIGEQGGVSVDRTQAEAVLRIGFLTDTAPMPAEAVDAYRNSGKDANREYTTLHGAFEDMSACRFMIYEPNGGLHPDGSLSAGRYQPTAPMGPGETKTIQTPLGEITARGIRPTDVSDRLAVQGTSSWAADPVGANGSTLIENRLSQLSADEAAAEDPVSYVFNTTLRGQLAGYVLSGGFVEYTASLYHPDGCDDLDTMATKGAAKGQAANGGDIMIVRLTENEPQRVRMFLWLEGEDVDCVNSAQGGDLIVNIELAGGNVS